MNKDRLEFLKEDYVQGFPAAIGFEVDQAAYGIFETRLKIRSDHSQQDGFVHAGVIATMADHTAAVGKHIVCRSKVVNNGKKIKVSESELFSLNEDQEKLIAKAMVTLIAIPSSNIQ